MLPHLYSWAVEVSTAAAEAEQKYLPGFTGPTVPVRNRESEQPCGRQPHNLMAMRFEK